MTVKAKPAIAVVPPEEEKGPVEYKRQVLSATASAARLRSLATQMSFRLDEGRGTCRYRVGVEDNGCHSLETYATVRESASVLECIARSLNAICIERQMIQNEIPNMNQNNNNNNNNKKNGHHHHEGDEKEWRITGAAGDDEQQQATVVTVLEPPLFQYNHQKQQFEPHGNQHQDQQGPNIVLQKDAYTRAELTFQRIETHLIDPQPVSVMELVKAVVCTTPPPNTNATTVTKSMGGEETVNGKHHASNGTRQNSRESGEPNEQLADNVVENSHSQQDALNHNDNGGEQTSLHHASDDKPAAAATTTPATTSTTPAHVHHTNNSTTTLVGETLSSRNIRVAVVGNVDAGKSTLIGTLTTSSLDDGRGKCRTAIMKHRHEIESGRTSTATTHLMGFKSTGEPVTGKDTVVRAHKRKTEDEVARESYRIITLMDLAGHEKYLKTTIHGVSSGFADYSLILVNSRQPPTHMTQHHLNLCCSFGIPVIIVFTKIDGCPEHAYKTSKNEVIKMLKSPEIGKKPFAVRNEEDVTTVMDKLHALAPMIETSCVTGEGVGLLQKMLFSLPKRRRHENKANRSFEFLVEDIFNVPGVGGVVSGFVNAGELYVGANCHVYVGPTDDGSFIKTVAKSAHIARINTGHITAGQSACLALALGKEIRKKLRRGMVVLKENPTSTRQFDAEICVLKGEGTTIRQSYQAYVHILNVRQSAVARSIEIVNHNQAGLPSNYVAVNDDATTADKKKKDINNNTSPNPNDQNNDKDNNTQQQQQPVSQKHQLPLLLGGKEDGIVLRPGSRAKVRFEFAKRPEYIRPGMRMLFRDGRVRGVGIITAIPTPSVPAPIVVK